MGQPTSVFLFWPYIMAMLYLILIGVAIYCLILFVKFTRKGIKAFEIYIDKNSSDSVHKKD